MCTHPVGSSSLPNRIAQPEEDHTLGLGIELGLEAEVDHFVPWSRYPDNGIHNLVVADGRCNGSKSDHLASVDFVALNRPALVAALAAG